MPSDLKPIRSSLFPHLISQHFGKTSAEALQSGENLHITGAAGSYASLFAAALYFGLKKNILFITENHETAQYVTDELRDIFTKGEALYLPDSQSKPYQPDVTQNANTVLRTEVIQRLYSTQNTAPTLIITPIQALSEKVIARKNFESLSFSISKGMSLDFSLDEILEEKYHFSRTDFVTAPGDFAVRGGIIDVFSFSSEKPFRIRLFGNEIENIKTFNTETQLTEDFLEKVEIISNISTGDTGTKRQNFLDILPKDTLILMQNAQTFPSVIDKKYEEAERQYASTETLIAKNPPEELFLRSTELLDALKTFQKVDFSTGAALFPESQNFLLHQSPQPSFNKNFQLLAEDLHQKKESGISVWISFSTEKQKERLDAIFQELEHEVPYHPFSSDLHAGFIDPETRTAVYTDHQIFDRYHKFKPKNAFAKSEQLTIKELMQMKVGDLVTHVDYGIGKFLGLVKVNNNGKIQEAFKLQYRNKDLLYVSIHSLHKISKFNGQEGKELTLSKLGSPAWKSLKNKTKAKVKELSFDLIKLYAKRKTEKGFSYSPDTYLQTELEASFMYEDTPDQEKATQDVKRDMENDGVMDRLICGDVGFGKTEVAIRAAFKAATDGKQVAVLVPTTVLAFQHYRSFTERLKDFPVKVGYLNRFRSAKQKKETLAGLADGSIDIVIGTHQLAGSAVKFKDLGLLIIDEEHKFGVSVKDKLKTLKANIDTLTLTATPIPRTLQFSLMAARDLSVIKTPPPNRQPVETHLVAFNEELIRDAVSYELERGGQVFFINNRVENLQEIAGLISRLVPDARIITGHGQMEGKELETRILDFMEGRYDVLVSTTIVESGVDVPNANTIFINDAQRFGMADLHQMRGRVGRSNKKAFCYLITPSFDLMTSDARKRLDAVQQFSDLGSGFHIAMKDLEIRGAGDLLGAEQSGFINEMGFETYQKIVQEALEELQDDERFKDLFENNEDRKKIFHSQKDVHIETDMELMLPDDYVSSTEERLVLYQRMAEISTPEALEKLKFELQDRYGALPKEGINLLDSIRLKWLAAEVGFEKIIVKNNVFLGYFPPDTQHPFYQGEKYHRMIRYLGQHPGGVQLKEKNNQYFLRKDGVQVINDLTLLLQAIIQTE